jgi:hypothetical protein
MVIRAIAWTSGAERFDLISYIKGIKIGILDPYFYL